MMTDRPVTILIVEDNLAEANLVIQYLKDTPGHVFRSECVARLSEALIHIGRGGIDGVLLDLNLPDSTGLATLAKVLAASSLPVVVLTGINDEEAALRAVEEGAQDYLMKERIDGPLLVRALRYAVARKRAERRVNESDEKAAQAAGTEIAATALDLAKIRVRLQQITPRQREVLQLLLAGRHVKRIAGELGITPGTVRNQLRIIREKLGANSIADLVRMALLGGFSDRPQ